MDARIGFARETARKLLREFGTTAPPVPIEEIVAFRGYSFDREPREDSWSGSLVGRRIVVNANHAMTRQRWTAAHELGHGLLAHRASNQGFTDRVGTAEGEELYVDPTDAQEVEANAFAAELLAPLRWVKAYHAKTKNPTAMAALFQLSPEAMWRACIAAGCLRGR
jgi:hypothetical protein